MYRLAGGVVVLGATIMALSLIVGKGAATVSGHVTMQGRPVIWGSVIAVGPDGRSFAGRIEPDGSFTVRNVPTGEVTLAISSPDPLVQHYKTLLKSSRTGVSKSQWASPPPVDRKMWFVLPKR